VIHEKALRSNHPGAPRAIRSGPIAPAEPVALAACCDDPSNLANLLQDQGDIAGARTLFERALRIREKAVGLRW
jgi:hypothetical protein